MHPAGRVFHRRLQILANSRVHPASVRPTLLIKCTGFTVGNTGVTHACSVLPSMSKTIICAKSTCQADDENCLMRQCPTAARRRGTGLRMPESSCSDPSPRMKVQRAVMCRRAFDRRYIKTGHPLRFRLFLSLLIPRRIPLHLLVYPITRW